MAVKTLLLDGTRYSLTFQDEFTGTNLSAWAGHGSDGRWNTSFSPHLDDTRFIEANGEQQVYVDVDDDTLAPTITQADGQVSLTARPLDPGETRQGQAYASGLLTTELTFGTQGGYLEMSARIPDQQGFLSAFWLLPSDDDWTAEIDVFEVLGHDTETLHTNVWQGGDDAYAAVATTDLSQDFHTYALHWTQDTITWLLDGEAIRTEERTISEEMYLAFSLAVGSDWAGSPDDSTDFSDAFIVDYVRVYEAEDAPDRNPTIPGDNSFAARNTYTGTEGDDTLYGSRWNDRLDGGAGDDKMLGRHGKDVLVGEGGDDALYGQRGHDSIFGGAGEDIIYGQRGHDLLSGGEGDDEIFGHGGRDKLHGGIGDDTLVGGRGKDRIEGGEGTDHLWGGKWEGDAQRDVFVLRPGDGTDYIHDFTVGTDKIDLSDYFTTFDALRAALSEEGWATRIDFATLGGMEGDNLLLKDVPMTLLTADDFILG